MPGPALLTRLLLAKFKSSRLKSEATQDKATYCQRQIDGRKTIFRGLLGKYAPCDPIFPKLRLFVQARRFRPFVVSAPSAV